MLRSSRLLLAALVALPAACTVLTTTTSAAQAAPPGTGWSLVFEDTFDDGVVDTTKWNYRTDIRELSSQKAANVTESGGSAVVTVRAESDRGKSFTGGGLITRQPFRYGYYETRLKTNLGPGWHTAFWNKYAPDGTTAFDPAAKTEVDGLEIDSVNPRNIRHNIFKWNGSTYTTQATTGIYDLGFDSSAAFHTYGFEWAETSVKYYVDGVLKATQTYTPQQYTHDYPHLWLSVVAAPYNGGYPDPAQLPATIQFDYFRYWQKDFYVDDDGPAAYGYSETGSWNPSTVSGWTVGSPTRYATCASAGNTATWRPTLRAAGTYQVFAYKVAQPNSDPDARYDVAGTTTHVDQTAGASGWVSLGTFPLPAGSANAVKLTSSGSGCTRADAVKFVRTS